MRAITLEDVEIVVACFPEKEAPDSAHAAVNEDILARAAAGETWAWCTVVVEMRLAGFSDVMAIDSLNCVSYECRADFLESEYYADMCETALRELTDNLERLYDFIT